MPKNIVDPRIDVLIQTYDQAFNKTAWHGTNLHGSLRGLKLNELVWTPAMLDVPNFQVVALFCSQTCLPF